MRLPQLQSLRTEESATSANLLSERIMIEVLLMHPETKSLHRCRVRVHRDGLLLCRVSGEPEAEHFDEERSVESEPSAIVWRSLRGFSADESYETPAGRRLQVLEIDSEDGVLTVLVTAADLSVLFEAVGRWSNHWRLARSPLGVVFGGRRRRLTTQVA